MSSPTPPNEPSLRERLTFNRELWPILLTAIALETNRLGITGDTSWTVKWAYRLYFVAVFLIVAVLPTWDGESTIFFGALLALAAAWLVAVPQATPELSAEDLKLVERGIRRIGSNLREVQESRGKQLFDFGEADTKGLEELPSLLAGAAKPAMLHVMYHRALAAAILGAIAILGLLIGPWVSHFHVSYWSPISLLFGLAVPDALLLLSTLIIPVMLQLYLTSLRFVETHPNPADEPPQP